MDGFNDRFNQTEINEGKVPIELQDLGTEVCSILYYVSFGCCFLVFLGYAFIRHFDPLHDRLTVRLIVYSAIAHIVLGTAGVIRINRIGVGKPNACKTIMFFYIFANLFSTMLITCIAINLQVVFVHGVKRKRYLERVYLLGSFFAAFILAAVPLFPGVDSYKDNPRMHNCWFKRSKSGTTGIWGVMGLYFWLILSTAYCLIALILVLGKMWRDEFIINRHLRVQTTSRCSNNEVSRWLYRFPWSLFFRPPQTNTIHGAVRQQQQRDEELVIENSIMSNTDGGQQSRYRFWPSTNVRHFIPFRNILTTKKQHAVHTFQAIRTRQLQVSYVAKVASRVIWFPIILILSRIWGVLDSLITFRSGSINPFTMFMGYVSVPMQGK
ncbi:hypothetical protein BDC45DRAFT_1700 [Circinella umbellata]|nr:hypothetical protein BDC45DRAFT_1700 [Circinella umbellata]